MIKQKRRIKMVKASKKNNKNTKFKIGVAFLIVLLIIWMSACMFMFIFMHENAHKAIFGQYNIESKITYGLVSTTEPLNSADWSKCTENCRNLQALNEIIGYPLQIIVVLCSIISFISILTIIEIAARMADIK